jgi:hypothetical protein
MMLREPGILRSGANRKQAQQNAKMKLGGTLRKLCARNRCARLESTAETQNNTSTKEQGELEKKS